VHPAARGEASVQKRAGRVCVEACAFVTKLLSSAHGADKADFGLGFQVKVLKPFSVVPASLGSENQKKPWQLNRSHQNQRAGGRCSNLDRYSFIVCRLGPDSIRLGGGNPFTSLPVELVQARNTSALRYVLTHVGQLCQPACMMLIRQSCGGQALLIEAHNLLIETHNLWIEAHNLLIEAHSLLIETHNLLMETRNLRGAGAGACPPVSHERGTLVTRQACGGQEYLAQKKRHSPRTLQ